VGWPCCWRKRAGSPPASMGKQCRPRLFLTAPVGQLWTHPPFQLCAHPRAQLHEEPSRKTGAPVAVYRHTPTALVGNSAKHARTQRTGAGCSVEDVRQQTHIRPATLDSMCWSAASIWV